VIAMPKSGDERGFAAMDVASIIVALSILITSMDKAYAIIKKANLKD
jgi:hypothetical protein